MALTGFVGVMIAVRAGRHTRSSRLFLASVLQTTLGAAFFALLPDFLSRLLAPDAMWRIACGTFGLYHLAIFMAHLVKQHPLRKMSALQRSLTFASVPVIGLKLSVGLGFFLPYAYSIYYLGLLWLLGVACYAFAIIVFEDDKTA